MSDPLPSLPRPIRVLVGAASIAVIASALVAIPAAIVLPPKPGFATIAFDSVAAVAGAIGLLTAMNRFRSGSGLALACVAGSIFACSVLGYVGQQGRLGSISLKPLLLGRVGLAGVIGASAALAVLVRDRRSFAILARAMIWALPAILIAGVVLWPRSRAMVVRLTDANGYVAALAALVAFLVALVSASGAVHLTIAAFSQGRHRPGAERAP